MSELLLAVAILGAAFAGGWYWMVPCLLLMTFWWRAGRGAAELGGASAIGLAWLAAFAFTGDRRLFFPYTLQFAVQSACLIPAGALWGAVIGAGSVVAAFTAIRIAQGTSSRVLAVELAVAIPAVALSLAIYDEGAPTLERRLVAAGLASILGLAGLSL